MANDEPTSLRMEFGYKRARASGVTGFRAPPTPSQMNAGLQWRAQEKELRALMKRKPSLEPIVRELIAEQWAKKKELCIDHIMAELIHRKLLP